MNNQQKETPVVTWPFPTINNERTKESQELLDSKHYKTKEVMNTNEYEDALF
jgi:hypothetical protein